MNSSSLTHIIKKYGIFFVLLITFVIYLPTLSFNFVWDDGYFITGWQQVRHFSDSWQQLLQGQSPMSVGLVYRPLRSLFYALSISLFDANPMYYHAQALVTHLLITLLIYLNAKQLFKNSNIALLTSLLFGIHPIHTEAVTWITASFDTLGSLFFFLSLYLYQLYRSRDQIKFNYWSLVVAYLAVFTYELTLTIVPIIFAYDYLVVQKRFQLKNFFKKYFFWLLLPIAYFGIKIIATHTITNQLPYIFSKLISLSIFPLTLAGEYLKLMIAPFNQSINHSPYQDISNLYYFQSQAYQGEHSFNPLIPSVITSLILLTLWIVGIVVAYKQGKKLVSFLLIFTLLALAPILQLIPLTSVFAEKYTYIASFGIISLLSFGLYLISKKSQKIGLLLTMAIIGLFSYLTLSRNQAWSDPLTFWSHAAQDSQSNAYISRQIAASYYMENDLNQAIDQYQQSLAVEPDNLRALINLGFLYSQIGQHQLALDSFNTALYISPNHPEALQLKTQTYINMGDLDAAKDQLQLILSLYPNNLEALQLLNQIIINN